jgi:hypothetical protein
MQKWIGKLFIYDNIDGQQYVSAANPAVRGMNPLRIQAFHVCGPFIPVGWPKALAVHDATLWMTHLREQGFICEPCCVD